MGLTAGCALAHTCRGLACLPCAACPLALQCHCCPVRRGMALQCGGRKLMAGKPPSLCVCHVAGGGHQVWHQPCPGSGGIGASLAGSIVSMTADHLHVSPAPDLGGSLPHAGLSWGVQPCPGSLGTPERRRQVPTLDKAVHHQEVKRNHSPPQPCVWGGTFPKPQVSSPIRSQLPTRRKRMKRGKTQSEAL